MAFEKAATLESLWDGEKIGVKLGGRSVLLVRLGNDVFAYEDRCAHLAVRLSDGRLDGCVLTCRAHEWRYDARTGKGLNPEGVGLRRFPVKIEDGEIFVDPGGSL